MIRPLLLTCIVWTLAVPAWGQVDVVHGTMFTLTNTSTAPNGSWCWFSDHRAIVDDTDPNNTLLLLSTVSAGASPENGDIDLLWRNLDTGVQGDFELRNQFQQDDHNTAALYMRPDGRYLAMYSKHTADPYTLWRVSTNPHDPTSWGAEQSLTNINNATYNNIYYLPDDNGGAGRTYNFTRADNWDPTVQISDDHGSTWTHAGKLLTQGGTGDRPYLQYASHGDKIHFIATEEHPRDFPNSIYHGYVQDGVLYNSEGTVMDANIFDPSGISPTALTPVFRNGTEFGGTTMNRAWTINLELDNTDNPVGIFCARANDSDLDHRYFYARFDGTSWQVNEMAHGGSYLYASENDYLGLASIDPQNANVVYMSNDVDPRSGATTGRHELYKGVTTDFGQTWDWTPITENSTMDNLRPIVPEWDGQNTAITWLRGSYGTYTNWSTEAVGIAVAATGPKTLLWRGDAASPTTWDVNAAANWDSGGGVTDMYNNGDEVAFDDTASSYTVYLPGLVTPMGVAFNNSANAYTVTGAGIGGSGGLRVIGGGTATLANGANTYSGDTSIARGTLALSGATTLATTPNINVMSGGTLDVTAVAGGSYTLHNQSLTIAGDVVGNVVAANNSTVNVESGSSMSGTLTVQSGSLVTGAGRITGNLVAESSTVRIGAEGLEYRASQVVIDDFESYGLGNVGSVASPPWSAHASSTYSDIEDDGTGNQVLAYGHDNASAPDYGGASRAMPTGTVIDNTDVATFFYRVNSKQDDPDHSFGLSDGTDTGGGWFSDYEAQVALVDDGNAGNGTFNLIARNGNSINTLATGLTPDTWYNVWVVVDQTTDTYDVYLNTGNGDATGGDQVASGLNFRNGTTAPLNTILAFWAPAPIDNQVRVDDLTYLDGVDLTNPLGGLDPVLVGSGETLTIEGDVTLDVSAVLALDVVNPTIFDSLSVAGNLAAGGTLNVTLDASAPAPSLGDAFDVLDFGSASGAFDAFSLPSLASGLAWNTSNLLTTGVLEVVAAGPVGDYNQDGIVDAADYTVWRDKLGDDGSTLPNRDPANSGTIGGDDYDSWKSNFGMTSGRGSGNLASGTVPEPSSCELLLLAATAFWTWHQRALGLYLGLPAWAFPDSPDRAPAL